MGPLSFERRECPPRSVLKREISGLALVYALMPGRLLAQQELPNELAGLDLQALMKPEQPVVVLLDPSGAMARPEGL